MLTWFHGPSGARGVSDACAVYKRISSMKALQLGRCLVKSTNLNLSIFETEIWAFPHNETACSICLGRLLHCGQLEPGWTPCAFDSTCNILHTAQASVTPPPPPPLTGPGSDWNCRETSCACLDSRQHPASLFLKKITWPILPQATPRYLRRKCPRC